MLVLGGLLLLQTRIRAGPFVLYAVIAILLLTLAYAMRIIRGLLGVVFVLGLVCAVLVWIIVRPK